MKRLINSTTHLGPTPLSADDMGDKDLAFLYGTKPTAPEVLRKTDSNDPDMAFLYGDAPALTSLATPPTIQTKPAPADAAMPPMESAIRQAKWRGQELTDATFSLLPGMAEVALDAGAIAFDTMNRGQNSLFALMVGDPKWKDFSFPELIVGESGQSNIGRAGKSLLQRIRGQESWRAPMPPIFRPSGVPPYTPREALTFEKDPVKRASMVAALEGVGKVQQSFSFGLNPLDVVDVLGYTFLAPDIPMLGGAAKVLRAVQGGKAATAAAKFAAAESRVLTTGDKITQAADVVSRARTAAKNAIAATRQADRLAGMDPKQIAQRAAAAKKAAKNIPSGVPKILEDAAPDIETYGLDLLKQASRPDIQSARTLNRYIATGQMDNMVMHDPRVASLPEIGPALFEANLRDPDGLLPSLAKTHAEKIIKLRGQITNAIGVMSPAERKPFMLSLKAARKRNKGLGSAYGKDLQELAAIVETVSKRTNAYAQIQHNVNWFSFFVDEPKDAIPEAFRVGHQARHLHTALESRLQKYKDRLFANIEPLSEADERIDAWLNAKRERIVTKGPDGREVISYKNSAEREALWWEMPKDEQAVARAWDDFQEQAADKLDIINTDRYQEGYGPWIYPKKDFQSNVPPDLTGFQTQGNVMFQHLLPRSTTGHGRIKSAHLAADSYIRGYSKKVTIQPAINLIREMRKGQDAVTQKYTNFFINELGGKASPGELQLGPAFDQLAAQLGSFRPAAEAASMIAGNFYYGMLINLGFVVKQMFQGINTVAKEGPLSAIKGLGYLISDPQGRQIVKSLDLAEEFKRLRESRIGVDALEKNMPGYMKFQLLREGGKREKPYRVADLLNSIAGFGDTTVRGFALSAGLSSYANKAGMHIDDILRNPVKASEAIEYGLRSAEATQFVYGVTGRNPVIPGFIGADYGRLFTMMQSFYVKQARFLLNTQVEDWGFGMDWLMYTGMAQRLAAKEYGIDPTSFSGPGMLVPSMRWGQPPAMSPPVSTLWALWGMISESDPDERAKARDNFVQLAGSYLIPAYLGMTKAWNGYKAVKLGAIQRKGRTIQSVTPRDYPGLATGLPLWSSTHRRYNERLVRVQRQRDEASADMLYERAFEAFQADDNASFDKQINAISATGFGPRDPWDRFRALLDAEQYSGLMRMYQQDPELFMESGATLTPEEFNPVVIRDSEGQKASWAKERLKKAGRK